MLRSAALSDPRVIELVNTEFVPVWINVRTTPLPPTRAVDEALVNASTDGAHRVSDLFSRGFFVRSVVLSPDGERLLNPQAKTVGGGVAKMMFDGELSYAEVNAGDYLVMLNKALERHRESATTVTIR